MSNKTRNNDKWEYIPKKNNSKNIENLGKDIASGININVITGRCNSDCSNITKKYRPLLNVIKNPCNISYNVKKQIYGQVSKFMNSKGIMKNNFYITNCNYGYTVNNKCFNCRNGLSFKINIDNDEYTVCYRDPKKCKNKILVCLHANYSYINGKANICLPYDKVLEEKKQQQKKLVVNNSNFPSVSKKVVNKTTDKKEVKTISYKSKIQKKDDELNLETTNNKKSTKKIETDSKCDESEEITKLKEQISELKKRNSYIFNLYYSSIIPIASSKKEPKVDYKLMEYNRIVEEMHEEKKKLALFWKADNSCIITR